MKWEISHRATESQRNTEIDVLMPAYRQKSQIENSVFLCDSVALCEPLPLTPRSTLHTPNSSQK